MTASRLSTRTIHAPFDAPLLAAWRALEATAACVPAAVELLTAATPAASLRVVVAEQDGVLVGIWAFRIASVGPLRVATRPGGPAQVYDGPTLHTSAHAPRVVNALWRVVSSWDDVDLVHLPAFLPDAPVRSLAAVDAAALPRERTCRVALSDLSSADDLVARQRKHRRKTIRRRAKALAKRGTVTFHTATEPEHRRSLVRWALATKVDWLDDQDALGATVRSAAFHALLDALAGAPTGLMVHALSVGQTTAAVELGFVDGDTYHSFLGTFDADFAKEGAGVALTLKVMQWCIEQGLSTYDLLAPVTDFKRAWSDHQRVVYAAAVPMNLRGQLAAPLFRDARSRLKQLGERLPSTWRAPLLQLMDRKGG